MSSRQPASRRGPSVLKLRLTVCVNLPSSTPWRLVANASSSGRTFIGTVDAFVTLPLMSASECKRLGKARI